MQDHVLLLSVKAPKLGAYNRPIIAFGAKKRMPQRVYHPDLDDERFADIFTESGVRTHTYAQVRSSGAR
jgi:hypothetical protein